MHRIGIVVYPDFQLMGLSAAAVVDVANALRASPFYDLKIVSNAGGLVRSSSGIAVQTETLRQSFDTLLVAGGASALPSDVLPLAALRSVTETARRVMATCTGAFVLAAAGLLDGRRATTHWAFAQEFRRRFPLVHLEEDLIFAVDGPVWTSAGMTAVFDLTLAAIEDDLGRAFSKELASHLVMYHRRAGGQTQHSALLELDPKTDRVRQALAFARANLTTDLSVERLADAARLSPRQLSRLFKSELATTPAKAVERLRVEAAQIMLEDGHPPIEEVLRGTGFANREQMRGAFARTLGQTPQSVRQSAKRRRGGWTG